MGFAFKTPKMPAATKAAEPAAEPAVVTETVQEDVTRNYEQKRSNKKGLLSTILSNHNRTNSLATQGSGNSTLG